MNASKISNNEENKNPEKGKETFPEKAQTINISVVCGNISKEEVDIIANQIDISLNLKTIAAKQIGKKAGNSLSGILKNKYRELIQKYKKIFPRDIFISKPGKIKSKFLIHRVDTDWNLVK